MSINVLFLPGQSVGDDSYGSTYAQWPYLGSYPYTTPEGGRRAIHLQEKALSLECLIAYRPLQNLELSLGGNYAASDQPSIDSEGQKTLRIVPAFYDRDGFPDPYDAGEFFYPSYPDLGGFEYTGVSSSHQEKFGIEAGISIISEKNVTTEYVCPFGFTLAPVPGGRFITSLVFHYDRQPIDNVRNDQTIAGTPRTTLQGYEITDATRSLLSAGGRFTSGLSDKSTASLQFNFAPTQPWIDQTLVSRYMLGQIERHNRDINNSGSIRTVHLTADFVNRPDPALELSLGAKFDAQQLLQDGNVVLTVEHPSYGQDTYSTRSSLEQSEFGVYVGVATFSDRKIEAQILQPSTFQLPTLGKGCFALTGRVALSEGWRNEASEDKSGKSAENWRTPMLRFSGMFLFGFSDETTILLSIGYAPPVARGDRSFSHIHFWPSPIPDQQSVSTFHTEEIVLNVTFAYRPVSGVELSIRTTYADRRQPLEGSTVGQYLVPSPYDQTSTTRCRMLDIRAGIAVLTF
jgi:hypothetical protein